MSEYKRITERWGSYIETSCENCKCSEGCTRYGEDCFKVIKSILAELEDKIESGLLVELPCKVGDTVYCIEYFCKAHGCSNDEQAICCGCPEMLERERKKQTYVISEKKFKLGDLRKINKTLYITQEAAEARLKELQEERN